MAQRTDYTNAYPRLDLAAIDQLRAATSTHTPEMWPVDADRSRRRRRDYGGHFQAAMRDLHESDDLRVLDFNAERAFASFDSKSSPHPVMFDRDEGS